MSSKSSRWQFTAFEPQWPLFAGQMPPGIAEWGWQTETAPETGRLHYQGYIRLAQQQRLSWFRNVLPGVHLEECRNWTALVAYCHKTETAVPGTQVHQITATTNHYQYAITIAKKILADGPIPTYALSAEEALMTVDIEVKIDIANGNLTAAWIASNPAWTAMWKKYWRSYLLGVQRQTDRQTEIEPDNEIIISPDVITNGPQEQSLEPQTPS